jgi:23S rRNA (pseudouridine1915-N3)-methyltransferase
VKYLSLCIAKIRFAPYRSAADEYLGRLRHFMGVEERELAAVAHGDIRRLEGLALLQAIPERSTVLVLDERGQSFDSPAFAKRFGKMLESGKDLVSVVGGARGLDEAVRGRAELVWAFGPMTLPHELARVVLYEQLYRAMSILRGLPYHKA